MKKIIGILCIVLSLSLAGCLSTQSLGEHEDNKTEEMKIQLLDEEKENILYDAEKLKNEYFIDEAIDKLKSNDAFADDNDITDKIEEYENYKDSFIPYKGDVEHIFFHSLIVYPDLAFDSIGHSANGYNMWFVTNEEFKKMLPELRDKGYVLVNINDVYKKNDSGRTVQQDIYLPKGKKPLILSQDDVNYYEYMKPDGFAERLVINEYDGVSTLVKNKNGEEVVTRDGDIVPILDDFVKQYPDFSYKGAKGTLAVTGYEGVLGYRLDSEENKEEAKKVCDKLKEDGWTFASHSYTHNGDGYFQGVQNYDNLKSDFAKWDDQIKPIVGDTSVFIAPFGANLDGQNINLVPEYGFDIYCNVCRMPQNEYQGNVLVTPRYNIDGYSLFNCKDSLNKLFFNADDVMSPGVRPQLQVEN